ncbi:MULTISPECIES: TonB-dependent receptor [unclassified Oceanobacter]|uniref:TonB-dependent receptor n=1 Tax=unclassified Oceanobacter TaxID=2620260 RepID=UPI002733EC53|nr:MULTISPECIES: TonB-dependent receptor [unclassified Oceanobacter]MDP2607581.1 TonB-dependent receptor [Oceanobacter sp. 1_MG-2023]MDP2610849.1 TonB-dependent receptor [Oceanobacter sp. 2_MG-2023]
MAFLNSPSNSGSTWTVFGSLAGCLVPLAAWAEASPVTDEIVVIAPTPVMGTGVRENQLVSPVQSLGSDDLERIQAQNIAEHLRYQLGSVSINEAVSNPYQPDVQYRGFTASPLLGLPQGVSVYMNGVRFNEPFGDTVNWDLLPTDAVSNMTLYSGSNPLFGQNTQGGAIAMTTKNGFNTEYNELELGAGQFGFRQAQFQSGGNGQLGNQDVGYYVLLNREEEDGWRDASGSDIRQAMSVLSWRSLNSSLNLTVLLDDNEMIGNGAVPQALMDIEGRSAIYTNPDITRNRLNYFALDGDHWFSDTLQLAGNIYLRRNLTTTVNGDDSDYEECLLNGAETLCEEDEDGGDEEPVTFVGYDDDDTLEAIAAELGLDIDADDVDGTLNTSRTEQNSQGFSLQLASSAPVAGRDNLFTAGVTLDQADIHFRSRTGFAILNNDEPGDARDVTAIGLYDSESEVSLQTDTQTMGVFFSNTLAVDDQLSVTVGARYNHVHIKMQDQLESGPGSLDGDHTFTRVNPMLGAAYIMDNGLNVYASYSESSRAPSPAELSCADENDPCKLPNGFVSDPPLEQVVTRSVEAGLKGTASRNIRWTAGVFRSTSHDDILFQQAGGLPSEGYFANVGKTRRLGTELGMTGHWSDVQVAVSYTWMRATFETPFVSFSPNNPQGSDRQVEAGDQIPGLPQHNLKMAADWNLLPQVSVGGDIQYRSSQYFRGDEANENEQLAGYTLVNVRASYAPTDAIEIYGRVVNVFDREYETFGVYGESDEVLDEAYPGFEEDSFVGPGAPRTVKAGIKIGF